MSSLKSNTMNVSLSEGELETTEDNLWLGILNQVQKGSSPNKLPSCKHLLVLGDEDSGKTSLIAKLNGNEDPKKGSGMEFHFLDVRDEYREDHTRLGVYILDGDSWHRNLFKFVLNEETFSDTTVLLTASMMAPWDILESLQNWMYILKEHVERLRLPKDLLEQHRNKLSKRFHSYLEPGAAVCELENQTENFTDIKINLGLDVICVVTKTDHIPVLEKELDYNDEYFDFIQLTLRKFCLLYGASLVYLSVKENKNVDLLMKFLSHRIYSFPFRTPAIVVEKDSVFIPSGWDCSSKANILCDNLQSMKPDDPYHEVIIKPHRKSQGKQSETEIIAENDQEFLLRLQSLMNQGPVCARTSVGRPVSSQESPLRTPSSVQKTAERRISGSPIMSTPKKIEGKVPVGSEGVLQNFFNSLLNRRTGSPIAGPMTPVRSPGDARQVCARHDAVAEFDRISDLSKKAPSFSEPYSHTTEDSDKDSSIKS